jgi:hypothetical protein
MKYKVAKPFQVSTDGATVTQFMVGDTFDERCYPKCPESVVKSLLEKEKLEAIPAKAEKKAVKVKENKAVKVKENK